MIKTKYNNDEIIGKRYGKVIITEILPSKKFINKTTNKKSSRRNLKYLCDCGNIGKCSFTLLNSGKNTQCKACAYANRPQSARRISLIERWFNLHIKRREIKGISIQIDPETAYSIANNNCYYCNKEPYEQEIYKGKFAKKESIKTNGLDRKDSNIGYCLNNVVPCCPRCNFMKSNLTIQEFCENITRVYNFFINKGKI